MTSALPPRHERITIGKVARLTGLSARTLRKYDAAGLLVPAAIDPETGYRYYSPAQMPRAETIRLLRSLDVPLSEVAAILGNDDPDAARQLLERQLERVERRIESDRHTVMRLQSAVTRGGVLGAYHCEVREIEAQPVVATRIATPREAVDAAVARGVRRLEAFAAEAGLVAGGREIVVYDFDPLVEDDYTADVCLPLASPGVAGPGIEAFVLPACTAAVTTHHGPGDDLQSAYFGLIGWILDNGLRIAGHERERYLVDERDSDDPRTHVTEVMWPVEPA